MFSHSLLQAPEKEVSDWLSDLIVVKQPPDLEVLLMLYVLVKSFYNPDVTACFTTLAQITCCQFLIKPRHISSLQGLPDPQTVSSSIQQMWALTEVMQANRTTASIGRFDVSPLLLFRLRNAFKPFLAF